MSITEELRQRLIRELQIAAQQVHSKEDAAEAERLIDALAHY